MTDDSTHPEDSGMMDAPPGTDAPTETIPMEPLSGPQIIAGAHVALLVSRGTSQTAGATATVPGELDKKQADALAGLQAAGFEVEVVRDPSDAFPEGTVMHQLPSAGRAATPGSKSCLIVSSGPGAKTAVMTVLPDTVGKKAEDATALIKRAGLVPTVIEDFSATVPEGVVFAQEPNSRTLSRPAAKGKAWVWILVILALLIGAGLIWWLAGSKAEVTVPDVVGLTETEAESALVEAGLQLGKVSEEATDAVEPGLVLSQDPEAEDMAAEGSRVNVVLARALEGVEVPDVIGLSEAKATTALEDVGLMVRVEEVYSEDVDEGDVVAQSPQPGTRVQEGAEVAISVSMGPEPPANVTVPDVSGMSESDAVAALKAAGLEALVVMAYHDTVPADEVIAQVPAKNTSVAPGTQVAVLVSEGVAPPSTELIAVPDVVDMTLDDATQTLEDLGFTVEAIPYAQEGIEQDIVFLQLPFADEMAVDGTTVIIFVGDTTG